MSWLRVTQLRSAIGLPPKSHKTLAALGLRRRMAVRYHKVTPEITGMVLKVKELVKVERVDRPLSAEEEHQLRSPPKGWTVTGNMLDSR
ncbi:39S ribosomal protein L33, mitochondrial [Savitreella phatthalungensis]